jgi:hypothetical protein
MKVLYSIKISEKTREKERKVSQEVNCYEFIVTFIFIRFQKICVFLMARFMFSWINHNVLKVVCALLSFPMFKLLGNSSKILRK